MVVWVLSRYLKYKQGDPRLPVAAAEPLARGSASSGLMDGSREAGGESSECLNGNHTRDLRDEYSGCDTRLLAQGYVDSHYESLSTLRTACSRRAIKAQNAFAGKGQTGGVPKWERRN